MLRYILHEVIGQGGMDMVYRATDRLTDIVVALKQVSFTAEHLNFSSFFSGQNTEERKLALTHEFQILASLRHPNIIGVLDYGFNVDESTLGWLPVLVACWMKGGCQKHVPTPGGQKWRHIFGAYNWATNEVVTLLSEKRDSAFIPFLDHLTTQHTSQRPLVIVLDNGSMHHSHAIQATLTLLENALLPLFLPKDCSQLNPIERFWKHLKSVACADKLFPDMDALIASVEQVLLEQNDPLSDSRFMFLKNFP